MTAVGTTNIKFSNLKTGYNNNNDDITTTQFSLSSFREALFSDGSVVPSSGAISIGTRFKGKTFTPFWIGIFSSDNWGVPTGTGVASGWYSAFSNNHDDSSVGTIEFWFRGTGTLKYNSNVSGEVGCACDVARVYIDDVEQWAEYGYNKTMGWRSFPFSSIGGHFLKFKYSKDTSTSTPPDYQWAGCYVQI
jgi:hypothetical protein